jgi:hypothetical protein
VGVERETDMSQSSISFLLISALVSLIEEEELEWEDEEAELLLLLEEQEDGDLAELGKTFVCC